MGTNYYVQNNDLDVCPCCGARTMRQRLHLGKSSGGWCFSLHVIPEMGLNDLRDWGDLVAREDVQIFDEYGDPVSREELWRIITERQGRPWEGFGVGLEPVGPYYKSEEEFHRQNHSQRGPDNLLRRVLGYHCVGHGEGRWDLIEGEFC